MSYLLDTNIIIFFFKGKFGIANRMKQAGIENCAISIITLAELKYGALNSSQPEKHLKEVDELTAYLSVIPLTSAIESYAKEKARLRKAGQLIDDFDLLIGCTALANNMTLVTNNSKHFSRLENLKMEDWAVSNDL